MDPTLALLLGLVVGFALGAVTLWFTVARRRSDSSDSHRLVLQAEHDAALLQVRLDENRARSELLAELGATTATATELEKQVRAQRDQYRDLAERHAEDRRLAADREQAENRVMQALSPVQETLRTMQSKVVDLESQRRQQHGELSEQLRSAAEAEERLRATAESLASALSNNATRGVWGETQLRNVVEAAGLTNRVDFRLQTSITTDAGAGRPDMVVNLPGGKAIAVDAKVPYNSYLEASRIPATATGAEEGRRRSLLAAHAKQVKSHIDALASKTYWEGLDASPEFTIAFIPSESLLAAALEQDGALLDYAFSRRIALASPVNLWAVLKTVAFTWQQDVLTEDAKRLFDLGKELYGRLGTLAQHADKLRRSIDATVSSYNQFASSLENRVLVTARKLDGLDESKVIGTATSVDQQARRIVVERELAALDETGITPDEFDGTGLSGGRAPEDGRTERRSTDGRSAEAESA
jgi:DNA recombination protein RmuC